MPTQFIWTNGSSDGLWSTAANWTDPLSGPSAVPGSGDYVYFGAGGSNTDSTMDLGSLSVDRVVMDANYTAALNIPSGNTLSTANNFTQYGTLNMLGGTLNISGYINVNGDIQVPPGTSAVSTITASGSFFLNQTGSITVAETADPIMAITSSGFAHGGTISIGVGNDMNLTGVTITGPFLQYLAAVTNVHDGATLTFASGAGGGSPIIQGTMNLYEEMGFGANVVTDTNLQFDGGTLNVLADSPTGSGSTITGDLSIFNSGEVNIGSSTSYGGLRHVSGDVTVGAKESGLSPTGGTLNIFPGNYLYLPTGATGDTFVVTDLGVINMHGWDTSLTADLDVSRTGLVINSGGELNFLDEGNTIVGNVTNNGLIDFGGALQTVLITGNFTQGSGGQLNLRMANGGTGFSDALSVTGTATLGGTLDLTGVETLDDNQQWTLITTGSGISGDFGTINWPDGNPAWSVPPPGANYVVTN